MFFLGTSVALLVGLGLQQAPAKASTVWNNETSKIIRGSWKKVRVIKSFDPNGKITYVKGREAYMITKRYIVYGAYGVDSYSYKVIKTTRIRKYYYVHGYQQILYDLEVCIYLP